MRTLRSRCRGSRATASRATSIWSAAVFGPRVPGPEHDREGLAVPGGAVVGPGGHGMEPFFQVDAACSKRVRDHDGWRPGPR